MKNQKRLTAETMDAIKNDQALMLDIASFLGKSWRTVDKWAATNYHKPFLTPAVMGILTKHFNKPEESLIAKPKKAIA